MDQEMVRTSFEVTHDRESLGKRGKRDRETRPAAREADGGGREKPLKGTVWGGQNVQPEVSVSRRGCYSKVLWERTNGLMLSI